MKIFVPNDDAKKCCEFAKEFISLKNKKSGLDFGSKNIRSYADKIADAAEGKIGEAAFRILMKKFGIEYVPDFSIQEGRLNTDDGQDVSLIKLIGEDQNQAVKIDIKTAKMHSQWLLAEKHKFWADIYVLIGIGLPAKAEHDLNLLLKHLENEIECEFKGYALKSDFYDSDDEIWFNFTEKSSLLRPKFIKELIGQAEKQNKNYTKTDLRELYKKSKVAAKDRFMNVKLKASVNYGLPVFLIRKDIEGLISLLICDDAAE